MTYSIYHFFANLIKNKINFQSLHDLEDFPYDPAMIAYRSNYAFPDISLRVNADNTSLTGGELIELKNAQSYTVTSFNSQIPQEKKALDKLNSSVLDAMRLNDPVTDQLSIRDVYYLVRGRLTEDKQIKENKVCLVSGKFFETISVSDLIQGAFSQVIGERGLDDDSALNEDFKQALAELFSEQESFSKTRQVENASVSIRFRIMTQVIGPGNILSNNQYPEIAPNTLNLVLPFYTKEERDTHQHYMRSAMQTDFESLDQFELKHPYNGSFWVFQVTI